MTKNIIKVWRWLPSLTMMIIIFLLSSMKDKGFEMPPALQPKIIDYLISKSAHVFLFGLLAFSFEFGFNNANHKTKKLIVLLVMLYGISDEIHQSFVPGREPGIIDVVIDSFAGWGVIYRKSIGSKLSNL